MSTHAPLALSGNGYQLQIIPAAIVLRDETIEKAKSITEVSSQVSADSAILSAGILKGLVKSCEACRKEIKAPVLDIGADIEAKAKEFRIPAQAEIDRLEELISSYVDQRAILAAQDPLQAEIDRAEGINPEKLSGASVGKTHDIFVHDLDALYKAHPQCVKLEEKRSAINDVIALLRSQNKPIEIPGVTVSLKTDVRVKATRNALAIQ